MPDFREPPSLEQVDTGVMFGMDLGVQGMQEQHIAGMLHGNVQRPRGRALSPMIRIYENANAAALVQAREIIKVHCAHGLGAFLDYPAQLALGIDVLMSLAEGLQGGPGVGGGGAADFPVVRRILPTHQPLHIFRFQGTQAGRAVPEQIVGQSHGR